MTEGPGPPAERPRSPGRGSRQAQSPGTSASAGVAERWPQTVEHMFLRIAQVSPPSPSCLAERRAPFSQTRASPPHCSSWKRVALTHLANDRARESKRP